MSLTYLQIDQERAAYREFDEALVERFDALLKRSWLFHEHALEGVVVEGRDIERALDGRPCRNYCDGVVQQSLCALWRGIDTIRAWAREGAELSVERITELHESFCDPEDPAAGALRERDTSPGVYHLDIVGRGEVAERFDAFIETYRRQASRQHPIRVAAMSHWELMRIFPFDERTGLVARLAMNFVLVRHQYPPAVIHASDRQAYFDALNGRPADMVPVVTEAIRCSIEASRTFAQKYHETRRRRAAF